MFNKKNPEIFVFNEELVQLRFDKHIQLTRDVNEMIYNKALLAVMGKYLYNICKFLKKTRFPSLKLNL